MYAYLTIRTRACDRVSFPDGSHVLVDEGAGQRVALAWQAEQQQAAEARRADESRRAEEDREPRIDAERAAEEARLRHAADHAEWQRMLDEKQEFVYTITELRRIKSEFVKEHPEPVLDASLAPPAAGEPQPIEAPLPGVREGRRWIAALGGSAGRAFVLGAAAEYPRDAVAKVLTELEVEGWSVVHVSEDRSATYSNDGVQALTVAGSILLRSA